MTHPPDFVEIVAAIEAESYDAALSLLAPLVDAGIPSAVGLLGTFYQLGLGFPPNGVKAVSLFTQAAKAGDALAAHNLGTVYCTGLPGVAPNPDLARSWYKKARGLGLQLLPPDAYE